MLGKNYLSAYLMLFAIGLVGVLVPLVMSRNPQALALVIGVAVAAAIPAPLIWLLRKLGYPIGRPVQCARCGAEQPAVRKPASVRQAMLGGHTCAGCGAELDARGRLR